MRKIVFGGIVVPIFLFAFYLFSVRSNDSKETERKEKTEVVNKKTDKSSSKNLVHALIRVDGMTCASCAFGVKHTINSLKGVKEVKVSLKNKSADVVFDPEEIGDSVIVEKINKIGYRAKLIEKKILDNGSRIAPKGNKSPNSEKEKGKNENK